MMAHSTSNRDQEWTTVTRRQAQRLPQLRVDRRELDSSSHVSLSSPRQRATYSTMLKSDESPNPPRPPLNSNHQRYTVQQPCRRQLCEDDQANQMDYVGNQPPFNLRQGYGTQVKKQDDNEFMELLLRCLINRNLVGKTDFVCHRNLLTNLSATPYEVDSKFDAGLMIVVQKINRVYYMFEFPTATAIENLQNMDAKGREMMYWGLKFESYVRARPGHAPDPRKPLNFNEEFCMVVTRNVGSHSILLRGEIDCVGPDGELVELKTNKIFDHVGHENSFRRHKLMKWWLQSSMVGVKTIVCGFRDEHGIVQNLQHYHTRKLPAQMLQCNPNVCMSFLDEFLSFVKSNVHHEFIPHVFQRKAHSPTFDMTLDAEGSYKFLPLWFVERAVPK